MATSSLPVICVPFFVPSEAQTALLLPSQSCPDFHTQEFPFREHQELTDFIGRKNVGILRLSQLPREVEVEMQNHRKRPMMRTSEDGTGKPMLILLNNCFF